MLLGMSTFEVYFVLDVYFMLLSLNFVFIKENTFILGKSSWILLSSLLWNVEKSHNSTFMQFLFVLQKFTECLLFSDIHSTDMEIKVNTKYGI